MANGGLTEKDIVSSIRESRSALRSLGVKSIGLFGSFVRDHGSPRSDVDMLVEFDSVKRTYDNFIDTCFFLEELLKRKVELVTTDSLSPHIKPYVLEEVEYVPLPS